MLSQILRRMKTWSFWFGVVGLIGTFWSIYTYFDQRRVGLLSYQVQTQKVFDPTDLKDFKLVTQTGAAIDKKVYASELVFWNSGNLNVDGNSDRIREPLKITLTGGQEFFYFIGIKWSPSEDNFKIDLQPDRKVYTIQWKFFDPGDGARLTLIHSGDALTRVEVQGKFYEVSLRNEIIRNSSGLWASWLLSLFIFVMSAGATTLLLLTIKNPSSRWPDYAFPIFFMILLLPIGIGSFYSAFVSHIPPF